MFQTFLPQRSEKTSRILEPSVQYACHLTQYVKVDSEVLFEQLPSTRERIGLEAENILKSIKTRKELYEQATQRVRWRMNQDDKVKFINPDIL